VIVEKNFFIRGLLPTVSHDNLLRLVDNNREREKVMRKFTNEEADAVAEYVALNTTVREMSRKLRNLDRQQKFMREGLKAFVEEHGSAINADNIVTITTTNKDGYTVAPKSFDKFNIAER
jgi:nitrous oxide reductase